MPGTNEFGQFHRVAGTLHIDRDLTRLIGTQVVNRRKMVEVIDLTFELLQIVSRDSQLLCGQVAKHRYGTRSTGTPVLAQRRHLVPAFLADQKVHHRALALQQFLDQPFSNKSGRTGNKVLHQDLRSDGAFLPRFHFRAFSTNPWPLRHHPLII